MALLAKSDLVYKDEYDWTVSPGDDPKKIGSPDQDELNRQEGYEILDFINKFAEKCSWKNKASGLKLEKLIRKYLPSDTRSHTNVEKWIKTNWNVDFEKKTKNT